MQTSNRKLVPFVFCLVGLLSLAPRLTAQNQKNLEPVRQYISTHWDALTRSLTSCDTIVDPKLSGPSALYLPSDFPEPADVSALPKKCNVTIRRLPEIHHLGEINPHALTPPGLLYLPNNYVVPGGRFNEMYGWDSYFIILGLLRDGRTQQARGMVENFFFEIEHYGAVLNANRSYYLTRSQPPFLTSMILAVYDAEKPSPATQAWLAKAYEDAVKDHALWTHEPHLAGNTGLSRYYDFGNGPAPESVEGEPGYYRHVAAYFLGHPKEGSKYLIEKSTTDNATGAKYAVQLCDTEPANTTKCDTVKTISLTADYYKGDRAMRESGFDISFRFGPYGAATHHYAPVGLNSLLYKTEKDLEAMAATLGKTAEAGKWRQQAAQRKRRMTQYFWDAKQGMFFDYNFTTNTRSTYEYATTFYPLWTGWAKPAQAKAVAAHLSAFEQPGGLAMSTKATGVQWDYPYGWAPIQWIATTGLRHYGFTDAANRIASKFVATIAENFQRDGTIREKYNVVTRSSETNLQAGYHENVVGFGWTNGVFLELMKATPKGK